MILCPHVFKKLYHLFACILLLQHITYPPPLGSRKIKKRKAIRNEIAQIPQSYGEKLPKNCTSTPNAASKRTIMESRARETLEP